MIVRGRCKSSVHARTPEEGASKTGLGAQGLGRLADRAYDAKHVHDILLSASSQA